MTRHEYRLQKIAYYRNKARDDYKERIRRKKLRTFRYKNRIERYNTEMYNKLTIHQKINFKTHLSDGLLQVNEVVYVRGRVKFCHTIANQISSRFFIS